MIRADGVLNHDIITHPAKDLNPIIGADLSFSVAASNIILTRPGIHGILLPAREPHLSRLEQAALRNIRFLRKLLSRFFNRLGQRIVAHIAQITLHRAVGISKVPALKLVGEVEHAVSDIHTAVECIQIPVTGQLEASVLPVIGDALEVHFARVIQAGHGKRQAVGLIRRSVHRIARFALGRRIKPCLLAALHDRAVALEPADHSALFLMIAHKQAFFALRQERKAVIPLGRVMNLAVVLQRIV